MAVKSPDDVQARVGQLRVGEFVGSSSDHRRGKERMNRGHSDHRRELSQKTKRAVVVERERMNHVCY